MNARLRCLAATWIAVMAVVGCDGRSGPVRFHAEDRPRRLSDWRVVQVQGGALVLNERVEPYDLVAPLFSDYAHKLRTVWMPEGTTAQIGGDGELDLPVGTILSKTFYYPLAEPVPASERGAHSRVLRINDPPLEIEGDRLPLEGVRLLETRLLVHHTDGWAALPYVWNEDQTEAFLELSGSDASLELVDSEVANVDSRVANVDSEVANVDSEVANVDSEVANVDTGFGGDSADQPFLYMVPDVNQCSGCHVTNHSDKAVRPIGPKIRHLDRQVVYATGPENQLDHWVSVGYLTNEVVQTSRAALDRSLGEALVHGESPAGSDLDRLEQRARAYLDINCAHCHNEKGPADTSGLFLDASTWDPRRLGLCKPPVAAGRGSGDRLVSIHPGRPDSSIMTFRMDSTDPGIAMPELGRSTVHREGVKLIREWIAVMPGDCQPALSPAAPSTQGWMPSASG